MKRKMQNNAKMSSELIFGHVPNSTFKVIGQAFKDFTKEDLLEIGSTIFKEDITPLINRTKYNAEALAHKGLDYIDHLKNTSKNAGLIKTVKSDVAGLFKKRKNPLNFHDTIILIPETQKRLNEFIHNISRDYSLLNSDEEKGKYIVKLAAYTSLFIVAFQSGADFPHAFKQKNFIRKTLLPILLVNSSLILVDRLLEQAEKKMAEEADALGVTGEIRKFVKIINTGIGSGMTMAALADGLTQTHITPKGQIDTLVHSTVLALFSKEIPAKPEQ